MSAVATRVAMPNPVSGQRPTRPYGGFVRDHDGVEGIFGQPRSRPNVVDPRVERPGRSGPLRHVGACPYF